MEVKHLNGFALTAPQGDRAAFSLPCAKVESCKTATLEINNEVLFRPDSLEP